MWSKSEIAIAAGGFTFGAGIVAAVAALASAVPMAARGTTGGAPPYLAPPPLPVTSPPPAVTAGRPARAQLAAAGRPLNSAVPRAAALSPPPSPLASALPSPSPSPSPSYLPLLYASAKAGSLVSVQVSLNP